MYRQLTLSVVAVSTMLCYGCDDNPTTTPIVAIEPTIGSSFTIANYNTDTIADQRVADTEDTATYDVTETKLSLSMKSNVTYFKPSKSGWLPFYINYESNGDISVLGMFDGPKLVWATYPISSKGSIVQELIDTVVQISPIEYYRQRLSSTNTYEGIESIDIKGSSVLCIRVRQVVTSRFDTPTRSVTHEYTSIYRYAQTLGFFTGIECPPELNLMDAAKSLNTVSIMIGHE